MMTGFKKIKPAKIVDTPASKKVEKALIKVIKGKKK